MSTQRNKQLVVTSAEHKALLFLATSEAEVNADAFDQIPGSLVDKGLLIDGHLSEEAQHVLAGAQGDDLLDIRYIDPQGKHGFDAYFGPEKATIVTKQDNDSVELTAMSRAHLMQHCAHVLRLLTRTVRAPMSITLPASFLSHALNAEEENIARVLMSAEGADSAFSDAVARGEWSIRMMGHTRILGGGQASQDLLLALRVGDRMFMVNPVVHDGKLSASVVPPMGIWIHFSTWFKPTAQTHHAA